MQSAFAIKRCLLFQRDVKEIDLDNLDPKTIFQPGDKCTLCSVRTGEAGMHGNGVIRLVEGLRVDPVTRIVEQISGIGQESKTACVYECKIPAKVRIEMM